MNHLKCQFAEAIGAPLFNGNGWAKIPSLSRKALLYIDLSGKSAVVVMLKAHFYRVDMKEYNCLNALKYSHYFVAFQCSCTYH